MRGCGGGQANSAARNHIEQVPFYPPDHRSSFLCPTIVNPGLVAVGHRVGMWRTSNRPPAEEATSAMAREPSPA